MLVKQKVSVQSIITVVITALVVLFLVLPGMTRAATGDECDTFLTSPNPCGINGASTCRIEQTGGTGVNSERVMRCYCGTGSGAAKQCEAKIKGEKPGTSSSFGEDLDVVSGGIGSLVNNLYTLIFFLVLAFTIGAIIFGGIQYASSAGNSSRAESAKELITDSLIALVLILGAGAILVLLRGPGLFTFN